MENVLKFILFIIGIIAVPFLCYGPLGWIVKDIYFSVKDIDMMTFEQIVRTQVVIYTILAMVYILVIDFILTIKTDSEVSTLFKVLWGVVFAVGILQYYVPFSTGSNILRWIIQLGSMILISYKHGVELLD